MKNNLEALNNYLFESIERLQDDSLDPDALSIEIDRADAVAKTATVIIANAEFALRAQKRLDEYGGATIKNPLLESGGCVNAQVDG